MSFFSATIDTCKLSQLRITKPLPSAFRLLASIMIRWKNGHCFKRWQSGQISELLCNSLVFPSLRLPLLQPNILTAKHENGSQSGPMVTGNPFCHIYGFHVSCSCLQSRRARFQSINITSKKQLVGKVSGGNFMRFRTGCQKLGEFDWQICGLLFHLLKLCLLDFGGCNFSQVSSWKLVLQEHPACRWQSSQNTSPTASARFLQRNILVSPQWRITWEPPKKSSKNPWSSGTPSPWLSEWPRPNHHHLFDGSWQSLWECHLIFRS